MIHQCALAVITERGRNVIAPTISPLAHDEEDFLQRHVNELRDESAKEQSPRGRFRPGSPLLQELESVLSGDNTILESVASELVESLAKAMQGVPNALDCVVALVTDGETRDRRHVSLLKLDAEIEAAQLQQVQGGITLRVFRDLLPRPGELQKGLSWPDPRSPDSVIIIKDRNPGQTALYFQNAFGIDASPAATDTERAFVNALAALPPAEAADALNLVGNGGPADEVVVRIKERHPNFQPDAPELGTGGGLAGRIRPRNVKTQKVKFNADGIDLAVPVDRLDRVIVTQQDGRYETRIVTSTPLGPIR